MSQVGVFYTLTKYVEYSFYGVDRATIVSKAGSDR